MFVLIVYCFDTFHVKGRMEMVCRKFTFLTSLFYLILGNKMLNLTGRRMFQREVNHGCLFFYSLFISSNILHNLLKKDLKKLLIKNIIY